jgi:hypothetical protein
MNAAAVYQDYVALKAHFSSTYNYQMYEGKIRISEKASGFVRDKLFFAKVGKRRDPHGFLLANIVEDKKAFIRKLAYSNDAERLYMDWVAKIDALSYIFKQDLKKMEDDFNSNLKIIDRNHPWIIVLYLGKEITLETLCIITAITECSTYWEKHFAEDPVMQDVLFRIKKYTPFIHYDSVKFKKAIVSDFRDR